MMHYSAKMRGSTVSEPRRGISLQPTRPAADTPAVDDPPPIPPLSPVAANPADRDPRRDQRQRNRNGSADSPGPEGRSPAAAVAVVASPIDDPLILALDRLRTTGAPRTADIAVLRMWRGLKAYQDQAVARADEVPPVP